MGASEGEAAVPDQQIPRVDGVCSLSKALLSAGFADPLGVSGIFS